MSQIYIPVTVVITPTNPNSGQQVSVTVTLNNCTPNNLTVNISTSTPGFFQELPQSVVVTANSITASFTATLTKEALGVGTVSATANGGTASTSVTPPSP